MTCAHCPCAAALARLEAKIDRLLPPREPELEPVPVPPLVEALAVAFEGDWFTSAEAMQRADHDADLWAALQAERIFNAYGLGRRLKRYGVEREGHLWHVRDFG